MNRCVECNKFRRWDDLVETHFIPDNEFGPEESEFTCQDCLKKSSSNEALSTHCCTTPEIQT